MLFAFKISRNVLVNIWGFLEHTLSRLEHKCFAHLAFTIWTTYRESKRNEEGKVGRLTKDRLTKDPTNQGRYSWGGEYKENDLDLQKV